MLLVTEIVGRKCLVRVEEGVYFCLKPRKKTTERLGFKSGLNLE